MIRAWDDWPLPRKTVAVVAGPLLLLFGSVLAIYLLERQTARAEADVRATLAVVSDLHEAHSLLAETAAAVRGYLLVREDNFLDPYRIAEPRLIGVVERLSERTASGPRADRFAALVPLFEEKMAGWQAILASNGDAAAEPTRSRLIEGKATLDVLRRELRVLGELERSELAQRSAAAASLRQRNLAVTLAVATLGGLGAVLAAGGLASGLSRRLRRLAAEADRLGEGLPPGGERVAGDEVGQVAQRLRDAGWLLQARARQLEDARRQAEDASRAKTDFLSRMSHELRTPLNAILGYAQLLGGEAGGRAGRFAGHIEVAGRHLLSLITEMLDVAGIEAGALALDRQPVRVATALAEAITLLAPQAAARGVSLLSPPPVPLSVQADPRRLRQVLLNLIGNAVKYGRAGGRVQLEASERDGWVELAVRDDGPGLGEAAQARLFRPFERIEDTARGVEGTGIGLALSKRLVEAMGGAIGVQSRPGEGARFWLRLPAAAAAPAPERREEAPAPMAAGPRRLLLVEDNASNRALVATMLERRPGWQLVQVTSLAEARAALAGGGFDLLLLDLHLPDGDGLALFDAPGALPPVLVLSADATPQARERVGRAGAAGLLTKPLDLRQFHAEIERCLQ